MTDSPDHWETIREWAEESEHRKDEYDAGRSVALGDVLQLLDPVRFRQWDRAQQRARYQALIQRARTDAHRASADRLLARLEQDWAAEDAREGKTAMGTTTGTAGYHNERRADN